MKPHTGFILSAAIFAGCSWCHALLANALTGGINDGIKTYQRGAPWVTLQHQLAKLRRVNALYAGGTKKEGKQMTAYPSDDDPKKIKSSLSSDSFISEFERVMAREFPDETEGLSSIFRTVIMKPAAQRTNISADSMKRQIVNFLDLIGSVDRLHPEDERLRDILEVFAYMPVAQPHQPEEPAEDHLRSSATE